MATIQGVYVALFGRPADPTGLAYFNGVTKNGSDLSAIGNLAGQKEYTDRFAGKSNSVIINSIYQSLFNRDAESAGLEFFTAALNKGTLTINNIAIAILDGAQGTDKTIVTNKVTAADTFTKSLDTQTEIADYSGNAAADAGRAYLVPVGAATSTIPSQAATDAAIIAIHNANNVGNTTVALTTADDAVSLTNATATLKTTNSDDTITSTNVGSSSIGPVTQSLTLNANDKIDGGLGVDTLIVKSTGGLGAGVVAGGAGLGAVTPASIAGVEKIFVTATGGAGVAGAAGGNGDVIFALTNATGVSEVWNDSSAKGTGIGGSAAVSFTDIASGVTLGLKGTIGDATTFTFKDVTGSADSATVVLDGAKDASAVSVLGVETVTLNVKSASQLDNLLIGSAKTVTITGDGAFTLTETTAAKATIDASAHTGAFTLNGIVDDTTVKGGAGVDTFNVNATMSGVKLTGGASSDLFHFADSTNITLLTNAELLKDVNIVTDFDGTADTLQIDGLGAKVALTNVQTTSIAGAATLADALAVAAAATDAASGAATNEYTTFQYKGDTYIYHDVTANGLDANDGLVQLVGFTGELKDANFVHA